MARMKKDGTPAKKPGRKPRVEIPEPLDGGPWEKMETPESVVKGPVTPDELYETFVDAGTLPEITEPEEPAEKPGEHYQTTALFVSGLGEFYHDRKFKTVDWRNDEGDEVSLPPFAWMMLSKELPTILKRIGAIK